MDTFQVILLCVVLIYGVCLYLTARFLSGDARMRVCFFIVGLSILGLLYVLVYGHYLDALTQMEKFMAGSVAVLAIVCYSAVGTYDKAAKMKVNAIYNGESMVKLKEGIDAANYKQQEIDKQTFEKVMAWITDALCNFEPDERKSILSCADIFAKTGSIAEPAVPIKYNEYYTQSKLREIGSMFLLLKRDREECAKFLLTIFSEFFTRGDKTELSTIKKKMPGVESARALLGKS